jgi:hypothetical protein
VIVAIAPHGRAESHPDPEANYCGRRLVVVIIVLHVNCGWVRRHINDL